MNGVALMDTKAETNDAVLGWSWAFAAISDDGAYLYLQSHQQQKGKSY